MKLILKPQQVTTHPKKALLQLEDQVTKKLQRNQNIDVKKFSYDLHEIGDAFVKRNEVECLNKHGKRFAEILVSLGNHNLAGIIYSLIIKLNPKHTMVVEQTATNALAIAKRFNDPVHIMARANDLKEIYKISQNGSKKHLQTLQTEKRALLDICNNYEGVKKRYQTLKRKMRPVDSYELKLAAIRYEIAQVLQKTNKNEAIQELHSALQILGKHEDGRLTSKIHILLAELKK